MENITMLKGVQYLVDSSGKRTAVVISLEEMGRDLGRFLRCISVRIA